MSDAACDRSVYLFHGASARFTNAVFSSKKRAETWIAQHELTGLLTEHALDQPAYDERVKDQALRQAEGRKPLTPVDPEQYTSGIDHWHYFFGLGEGQPGFDEASDRWEAEYGQR